MEAEPFLWGSATSAHQVEGGNSANDWWDWEEKNVRGGERSGRAADHWNRFREDLRLAASMGHNSYRFSVEWSRVEPKEGEWDEGALDRYAELIGACEENGLLPMLTLHHFTNPRWFAAKGAFLHPSSPALFRRFAEKVADRLGSRVPLWVTFNEPMVYVVGAYLGGYMPPGSVDRKAIPVAIANLLRAHALAYDAIHSSVPRREGPWSAHPLRVGVANHLQDFRPARSWHPAERLLSRFLDRFFNEAWLRAQLGRKPKFGIPGLVGEVPCVREARGRKTCDFLGLNFYTTAFVHWMPRKPMEGSAPGVPFGLAFARPGEEVSDVDWAPSPEGFARVLERLGKEGLPIYVTENGIADRADRLRASYLRSHVESMRSLALGGACDVRGYYHWSLLDNYEWVKGFGPRFGLFEVDYETLERKARPSAEAYREIIRAGFP